MSKIGQGRSVGRRLRRALTVVVLVLVGLTALVGGCTCYMYMENAQAGREIAADTEWGRAFQTVDYVGRGDLGVLFLHNLHGTPQDFKLVFDELEARDIHYYAPMLGGERPAPAVQNGFTPRTFSAHAERAYSHLSQRCKRIIVVGASAGGVQAADVAERYPVERVVLISPAFRVAQTSWVKPSTEFWTRFVAFFMPLVMKGKKSHIDDPEALAGFRGFRIMAMHGAVAFIDYAPDVLARVDSIDVPVLCLISRRDEVIDVATAEAAFGEMQSTDKRIEYIDESNHMILIDHGRERAAELVVGFVLESVGEN